MSTSTYLEKRIQLESNLQVQQIQLRKLAAYANREKSFEEITDVDNTTFQDLLEGTEEMLRLLKIQRDRL